MNAEAATNTSDKPNPLDPQTIREMAALSEEEMANLMGMSANGYRLWENGQRRPGGPAFKLLALLACDTEATVRHLRSIAA